MAGGEASRLAKPLDRAGSRGAHGGDTTEDIMADAAGPSPKPEPAPKKQAVVLIHGIGEQTPMETLWKLVELVWLNAPRPRGAPPRRVYSEADDLSGVFELRRLSTNHNADGKRTDFFEYYWAHLMNGNELGDVLSWLGNLAMRRREQVPRQLHKAWTWLRMSAITLPFLAFLWLGGSATMAAGGHLVTLTVLLGLLGAAFGLLILLDQLFFSPVLGDAARYLRPTPKNIACRQAIRENGLKLLEALHESGKYDRIVIVGHSLGGVIAYELVCHLWGRRHRLMDQEGPLQDAFISAEEAALALLRAPNDEDMFKRYRAAQAALHGAMLEQSAQNPHLGPALWLVTDLVTLGSPVAHADTLIAHDRPAFDVMVERRELLTSPPALETFPDGAKRFTYSRAPGEADNAKARPRAPHNGAAFAVVRWTNIYFPMQGIMRGDLIGGPVRQLFGPGAKDVAARAPRKGGWFPHLDYFNLEAGDDWGDAAWAEHRQALRAAMNLETPAAEEEPKGHADTTKAAVEPAA